jgi:hypothetical protein
MLLKVYLLTEAGGGRINRPKIATNDISFVRKKKTTSTSTTFLILRFAFLRSFRENDCGEGVIPAGSGIQSSSGVDRLYQRDTDKPFKNSPLLSSCGSHLFRAVVVTFPIDFWPVSLQPESFMV